MGCHGTNLSHEKKRVHENPLLYCFDHCCLIFQKKPMIPAPVITKPAIQSPVCNGDAVPAISKIPLSRLLTVTAATPEL